MNYMFPFIQEEQKENIFNLCSFNSHTIPSFSDFINIEITVHTKTWHLILSWISFDLQISYSHLMNTDTNRAIKNEKDI
jgi:hypothetical protein